MIVAKLTDLPAEYTCNLCGQTKPVAEMVVVRRRELNGFHLRPRCKTCHNERERGHRRDYKTKYLKRWRSRNADVNKSYRDTDQYREKNRVRQKQFFEDNHDAILIRGRMCRRGEDVSLDEAKELLAKYGRCYPSRFGLTAEGLKECERIRSRRRRRGGRMLTSFQIRLMVYEDGHFIEPDRQPRPFKKASERLRELRQTQERKKGKYATQRAGTSV